MPQQQPPTPPPALLQSPPIPVVINPGLQGMPLDQLLDRYNQLTQTVATLRSQREILYGQAARLPKVAGGERAALRAQAAGLDAQITSANLELAAVRSQLQSRLGSVVGTLQPPAAPPFRQADPDLMTGALFVFILAVLMPLSIGLARKLWRGSKPKDPPRQDDASAQRLERLEQAVDTIAIEIERISEGQRFITKIMSERSAPAAATAASVSATVGADGQPALGEGAPRLALGAGPAESVHVGQKQGQKVGVGS